MIDRLVTLAALLLFVAFLTLVVVFVEEIDLAVIVALVVAMAFVEFLPVLRGRQNDK